MANFTFNYDDSPYEGDQDAENPNRILEMQFNATFLESILNGFADFLRGAGYIIDGEIMYVPHQPTESISSSLESHLHHGKISLSGVSDDQW